MRCTRKYINIDIDVSYTLVITEIFELCSYILCIETVEMVHIQWLMLVGDIFMYCNYFFTRIMFLFAS